MKLRYFAWVRMQIGRSEEELEMSPESATVAGLLAGLAARGGGYAVALAKPEAIRVAVNHETVNLDHPLRERDEVALFPPMTGG